MTAQGSLNASEADQMDDGHLKSLGTLNAIFKLLKSMHLWPRMSTAPAMVTLSGLRCSETLEIWGFIFEQTREAAMPLITRYDDQADDSYGR